MVGITLLAPYLGAITVSGDRPKVLRVMYGLRVREGLGFRFRGLLIGQISTCSVVI